MITEDILKLDDKQYTDLLLSISADEDRFMHFDQIDDILAEHDGRELECARLGLLTENVLISLSDEKDIQFSLGNCYNTLVISLMMAERYPDALNAFKRGIGYCERNRLATSGERLCYNIFHIFNTPHIPQDESIYIIARARNFLLSLGMYSNACDALSTAARNLADLGAFAAAYRACNEIEEIITEHKLPLSATRRLQETICQVHLLNGNSEDFKQIEKTISNLEAEIYKEKNIQLMFHYGLAKLRLDKHAEASVIFHKIITSIKNTRKKTNKTTILNCRINLAVCERELNDEQAFNATISEIEKNINLLRNDEIVEAKLVIAKGLIHFTRSHDALDLIRQSVLLIDKEIQGQSRLHYRRGIRERYAQRIKHLIACIPEHGNAENAIPIICFLLSNSITDWLSFLDWADECNNCTPISPEIKSLLNNAINDLCRFGTPYLYGFREKYEDPLSALVHSNSNTLEADVLESFDFSLPWRRLNNVIAQIRSIEGAPKLSASGIKHCIVAVSNALKNNQSILASFATSSGLVFIYICNGRYTKVLIPVKAGTDYFKKLQKYQENIDCTRSDFMTALHSLANSLSPLTSEISRRLESDSASGLIYAPDWTTDTYPIFASLILSSEYVRRLASRNQFTYRTCPAPTHAKLTDRRINSAVFIINSNDKLPHALPEQIVLDSSTCCFSKSNMIDLAISRLDFTAPPLSSADLIHFASHSMPATRFTDPFFVSTAPELGENGILLESVQRESLNLKHKLVVLLGCNTGASACWNYFKYFRSNEKVGLGPTFILNRQSSIVASSWNLVDILGFIFSSIFYKQIATDCEHDTAYAKTVTELYELSTDSLRPILALHPDQPMSERTLNNLTEKCITHPFRDIYYLASLNYYSLIPNYHRNS